MSRPHNSRNPCATMSGPSQTAVFTSTTSLPSPSQYERNFSYQDQWKKYKESYTRSTNSTSVIYGLDWWKDEQTNDLWLVGCTSAGEICVWRPPPSPSLNSDHDEEISPEESKSLLNAYRKPILRRRVSNGVLYSIQVTRHSDDRILLVTAGDDGVLIFDWKKDIIDGLVEQNNSNTIISPMANFRPWPSAVEDRIEINDVQLCGSHLFGAAGDAFGCYKWDLETQKLLTTYRLPGHGYMHSVEVVPNNSGGASNLLLTGGEDGILGIWDRDKDKFVDKIDMANAPDSSSKSQSRKKQTSRWISSVLPRDENWWTVAGGKADKGGFLSTFHAPTRSLIASVETHETPQNLAFCNNAVVSVANESVVSHWNPLSLERTHRVWCGPPSAYAAAVAPDGTLAVAGVGTTVDLFENATQKTFVFSL
jgi:hypothetical protein